MKCFTKIYNEFRLKQANSIDNPYVLKFTIFLSFGRFYKILSYNNPFKTRV